MLLTIGANDILFSGLIANVMIKPGTERSLLSSGGIIASVEEAQTILGRELPGNFAKARAALKPLVGGNLSRVVYVTYGNPALAGPETTCPGGRDGFDVHPAFAVDGERLRQAVASRAFRTSWGEAIRATVSIGLASSPEDGGSADELFRAADRALYSAKQAGRNRVLCART